VVRFVTTASLRALALLKRASVSSGAQRCDDPRARRCNRSPSSEPIVVSEGSTVQAIIVITVVPTAFALHRAKDRSAEALACAPSSTAWCGHISRLSVRHVVSSLIGSPTTFRRREPAYRAPSKVRSLRSLGSSFASDCGVSSQRNGVLRGDRGRMRFKII
jgi:hypothetical protein